VTFTAPRDAGRAIRVHVLRLDRADTAITRAGLRVTTPERTALDCLATFASTATLDLWAWVSSRRILDLAQLDRAIACRRHWYGTPQLIRLRELVGNGAVSGAEHQFHQILRDAGLSGWTANTPIQVDGRLIAVADILFAAHLVVIEIDGWRSYSSRTSFVSDRRRQNRLITAGYLVLRFTWDDLVHRPAEVIAEVREALGRRGHRG
jgi:very-short-patch-repair endonuclease